MLQRGRGDRIGEGKKVEGGDRAEERKSEKSVNNQKEQYETRKKKQGDRETKRKKEVELWRTH